MAGASSRSALAFARRAPPRRAILRRSCRDAGSQAARALLNDANPHVINFYRWLARGLVDREPTRERRTDVLPPSRSLQRTAALGTVGEQRGGRTLLLPQSHRLQRTLPIQPIRCVQRALRTVSPHPLRARLHQLLRRPSRRGRSRAAISLRSHRARRLRLRRSTVRRGLHALRARRVLVDGSRAHGGMARSTSRPGRAGESVHATDPKPVSLTWLRSAGLSRARVISTAPAIARRPERWWRPETCSPDQHPKCPGKGVRGRA